MDLFRLVRAARAGLFSAAALLVLPALGQSLPVVSGERAWAPKAAPIARVRLATPRAQAHVLLRDAADEAIAEVRRANERARATRHAYRRVVVGVEREAPEAVLGPRLEWRPVAGGFAAQVTLTSPRADSMRLAIDLSGVDTSVEMVFFGSFDPSRVEGPVRVGDIADRTQPWWSPVTEGDTQTVEFFVPVHIDPRAQPLRIARASHLVTTPSSRFTKRLQDIGRAGSCNVDLPCSSLLAEPGFRDVAASVAQMIFNDGGFSALCTGSLLNDADPSSQVPYFYGANHCFENQNPPYKTASQMQAVANTLVTLWGFEADACNSNRASASWTQRTAGATVLYNHQPSDVLLLRLRDAPPANAFYSGYDPNPLSPGTTVVAIHHPLGDLKKVTEGFVRGFSAEPGVGGPQTYVEVGWTRGTTEGGSSGGGLWTRNGAQWLLRGGLWGGSAFCSNASGSDFYSRLDQAYPAIAQHLAAGGGGAVDYTDLWWNPNESGWGLNLIQHPSRTIFGVWYTYAPDGNRTWFVLPSGTWTSSNTYTGALYATSGPNLAQSFDASKVKVSPVGTATITFSDVNNGTFAYSVNGTSGSKAITRQPF